jgi:hypothetical protein
MLTALPCIVLIAITSAADPEPPTESNPRTEVKDLEMDLGRRALHDDMIPVAIRHFQRAAQLDPSDTTARYILEYCETLLWDRRNMYSPPGYEYAPGGPYGWPLPPLTIQTNPKENIDADDDGFVAPMSSTAHQPQGQIDIILKQTRAGEMHTKSGSAETALALRAPPSAEWPANMGRARVLLMEGHPGRALAICDKLARLTPHDYRIELCLGDASAALGLDAEANIHYRNFVRRAPVGDASAARLVAAVERKIGDGAIVATTRTGHRSSQRSVTRWLPAGTTFSESHSALALEQVAPLSAGFAENQTEMQPTQETTDRNSLGDGFVKIRPVTIF